MTAEATIGARSRGLLALERARALVLSEARPLPPEPVDLASARGRVLAQEAASAADVPPFDNSAMDGYAVRAADTAAAEASAPVRLAVVGEARAGRPLGRPIGNGEAALISTGAPLPEGADAVVRIERARADGDAVLVAEPVTAGSDVRRAGEDIRAGETVLGAGTPLGPAELGVLASAGVARPLCARRPRVAIVSTGDELAAPGEPLAPGMIHDANRFTVPAQAEEAGCEVAALDSVPDEAEASAAAIAAHREADVVVVCGGVSVGRHDHVKDAFAAAGFEERFWGVALRPGRPTWFGVRDEGARRTLGFGLPGNPVSAMVTFALLVVPGIDAMTRRRAGPPRRVRATMDEPYAKRPGRAHAVRCRLELAPDGWHARPTKEQGSHILTSMLGADGLAIIATESAGVRAGDPVEVELLRPVS